MDNKHKAVWEWMLNCPYINDLCFNFSEAKNGNTVIVPDTAYNDSWIREFTSGSGEKNYTFTIIQFRAYSNETNSTENIDVIVDFEKIAQWIDEQNELRNFPDFPSDCIIQDIVVLPFANGGISSVDDEGAKYMFSIQIEYLYRKDD